MVEEILRMAGIPYRESRFPDPPDTTFAVYLDNVEASGADGLNLIFEHDIMVELYERIKDDEAEAAVEEAIDAHGLPWTKQARYWLQDVQRYQVVYEFTYFDKRRAS